MANRAALWAGLLHRHCHRRAWSFRDELPDHSPMLVSVLCPYPPAHTHRSSRISRVLHRLAGVGTYNGVTMVWREAFNGARPFLSMFYDIARACSSICMCHPRRVPTLALRRTRSMHAHVATREHVASVAMEAVERTHRGPEKPCEREKKYVEENFA